MTEMFTTYLLALAVQRFKVEHTYEQLPMHCTVMHRFHSDLTPQQLIAELQPTFTGVSPIALVPQDHVAFGPKKQLVTLVELTPPLKALHQMLHGKLNQLAVKYTEADWVGSGYTPHVTDKKGQRLPADRNTVSSSIYLISVEHPLQGHSRYVHHKFELPI